RPAQGPRRKAAPRDRYNLLPGAGSAERGSARCRRHRRESEREARTLRFLKSAHLRRENGFRNPAAARVFAGMRIILPLLLLVASISACAPRPQFVSPPKTIDSVLNELAEGNRRFAEGAPIH